MPPSGEPQESPKPQPIGNYPLIALFTTCTLCALFLIWRRANNLRTVVAHQLKTWTGDEGRIRLSEDDGPPARSFVDNNEEDEEDAEPLAVRVERLRGQRAGRSRTPPLPTSAPSHPTTLPPSPKPATADDPLRLE